MHVQSSGAGQLKDLQVCLKGHSKGKWHHCPGCLLAPSLPVCWVPENTLEQLRCSNSGSKQLLQPTLRGMASSPLLWLVYNRYRSQ